MQTYIPLWGGGSPKRRRRRRKDTQRVCMGQWGVWAILFACVRSDARPAAAYHFIYVFGVFVRVVWNWAWGITRIRHRFRGVFPNIFNGNWSKQYPQILLLITFFIQLILTHIFDSLFKFLFAQNPQRDVRVNNARPSYRIYWADEGKVCTYRIYFYPEGKLLFIVWQGDAFNAFSCLI